MIRSVRFPRDLPGYIIGLSCVRPSTPVCSRWCPGFVTSFCLGQSTLEMDNGWLVVWNSFFSPYLGNFIIPTDEVIFFRRVAQPPTRWCFLEEAWSTHHQLICFFFPKNHLGKSNLWGKKTKRLWAISNSKVWTTALQWFTCVRPKAFSLSVNARARGIHMESNSSFEELLRRVGSGAYLLGGDLALITEFPMKTCDFQGNL